MSKTKIPWATHSINPIRVKGGGWHCTKVSAGCQNCYSETKNMNSFFGGNKMPYDNRKVEYYLDLSCFDKLPKTKPQIVFVQSMSDLFHDDVPFGFVDEITKKIFNIIGHKFLILTKHPKRMKEYFDIYHESFIPIPNLWLGVTVEHPDYLWRVNELLQIPAAVRFVSLEPLLGAVNLKKYLLRQRCLNPDCDYESLAPATSGICPKCSGEWHLSIYSPALDWVIVGAESGRKRRECKIEWVRNIVEQCKAANVPVFVKQLHINDKVSDNMAEWPEELRVQEWPA